MLLGAFLSCITGKQLLEMAQCSGETDKGPEQERLWSLWPEQAFFQVTQDKEARYVLCPEYGQVLTSLLSSLRNPTLPRQPMSYLELSSRKKEEA